MTGATCGIKFDAQTEDGPSWLSQHRHHSWVPVWFAPVGGFAPTPLETYGSIFSPFPQKWGNSSHYDSWLFHKGCLSLHSWWDAMLAHNGTYWVWDVLAFSLLHLSFIGTKASFALSSSFIRKSPCANLGCCLCNHRKTLMSSVYLFLFPWESFPRQTC